MLGRIGMVIAAGLVAISAAPSPTLAQGVGLQHPASGYYRSGGRSRIVRGPQVRGFAQRRVGGYSYYTADTINTYGNNRSIYGGVNSYRDALQDRQGRFGPFDHGFFFDSGITPRGGYSPYMN